MTNSNTARKHHFVPQFYLRKFTGKRDMLFVVDRTTKKSFFSKPHGIAAERDFNSVDIEGWPIDVIEKKYAEIETHFERALNVIIKSSSIEDQQALRYIVNMMTLFLVRNPRLRDDINHFTGDISRHIMSLLLSTKERWETQTRRMEQDGYLPKRIVSYEEMKEFNDGGEYDITIAREYHIYQELMLWEKVFPQMEARNWCLVRANSGYFVTSDYPLSVVSDGAIASAGVMLKDSELFMPLTPELGLFGTFRKCRASFDADYFAVSDFNTRTIAMAIRHVCAPNDAFEYLQEHKIMKGSDLAKDPWFIDPDREEIF